MAMVGFDRERGEPLARPPADPESHGMSADLSTEARPPAVAGSFYPSDPDELAAMVDKMLQQARAEGEAPKAVIAPHAGYIYSGPIAASAYVRVGKAREVIRRVVLLGPAHRVALGGLAVSGASAFRTPLGEVPLDRAAIERLLALPQVTVLDAAHAAEHSLEVQLPFLQRVLGPFSLVPLVVGQATPEQVAEVLEALWGGPETLVVISSDLSHYHDYDTARRLDAATSRAIEALAPEDIGDEGACGRHPIGGLLRLARKLGLKATTIDLRNSGDTAGDKAQVVGYGAYVFEPGEAAGLDDADREALLRAAAATLRHGLDKGRPPQLSAGAYPQAVRAKGASFVTLTYGERLRGCIGTVTPLRPLVEDVAENAYGAAFDDTRFKPLGRDELAELMIGISVLGPMEPLAAASEAELLALLVPGRDGLMIEAGGKRGVFLPQVWEALPDGAEFLRHLKSKAGLDEDAWPPSIAAFRFHTHSFSGPAQGA
jgi:AmmeMemoRadiSam system protein B/AmmeMemoRadiSam system protein A